MSNVMPDCANPAPRLKMLNRSIETMNMLFLPNKSAILPKNNNRDPAVNLNQTISHNPRPSNPSHKCKDKKICTYELAAFIHVISALLIPNSRPAKLLITVIAPVRKLDMATAIVTDMTNKHS